MGDGRLSAPLERRGLGIRSGERGPVLAGDGCRFGELANPGSTRLLRLRSRLRSEHGESVRGGPVPGKTEELSLFSPLSVSVNDKPRRDGWEEPRLVVLLYERGVGHSIGVLGPVDTAVDETFDSGCEVLDSGCEVLDSGCEVFNSCWGSWNLSGELRIDIVNADVVDVVGRGGGDGGGGCCCCCGGIWTWSSGCGSGCGSDCGSGCGSAVFGSSVVPVSVSVPSGAASSSEHDESLLSWPAVMRSALLRAAVIHSSTSTMYSMRMRSEYSTILRWRMTASTLALQACSVSVDKADSPCSCSSVLVLGDCHWMTWEMRDSD